jgi:hypothetical protein
MCQLLLDGISSKKPKTLGEALNSTGQEFKTPESENMMHELLQLLKVKQILEAAGIKVGP